MSDELAKLISSKFIARPDVKARQLVTSDGKVIYMPDGTRDPVTKKYTSYNKWTKSDLISHLSGEVAYGHYLLGEDDQCKLFAFDVDLEKFADDDPRTGWLPTLPMNVEGLDTWEASFAECKNPREAWRVRDHPARDWMKLQFRKVAHMLVKGIETELGIPCAAAYTGNKGIHVYGFTGRIPAEDAREAAMIVLDSIGGFSPLRGEHFFQFDNKDPRDGYPNLSIEVFPKQASLSGKEERLGNLMRLPLGRNLKTKDPTFFIDMTSPMSELRPVDPIHALTTSNPWSKPGA